MNADEPNKANKLPIREWLQHSQETARQLMYPPAYRIDAPGEPDSVVEVRAAEAPAPDSVDQLHAMGKTLAAVATALWRVKGKLAARSGMALPDDLRNLPRYIQSAWDALEEGNIQVDDHLKQPYVPGMAVNILTFQPLDGISSEVIHETIKPSVYFHDVLIQRADVIVARPNDPMDQNAAGGGADKGPDSINPETPGQKGTADVQNDH